MQNCKYELKITQNLARVTSVKNKKEVIRNTRAAKNAGSALTIFWLRTLN